MYKHFFSHSRLFNNTSVGSKISFKYCNAACLHKRIINRSYYALITVYRVGYVFRYCFSRTCDKICFYKSCVGKLFHNRIYSAGSVQIFHICITCRSQMAKVRCLSRNLVCIIQIKFYSAFMRYCRKMKHCVCWTSESHIYCFRIMKSLGCHNVSGSYIFLDKFHYFHSRFFCKTYSCGVNRRYCSVSSQTHAYSFRKTVHRVGSIHSRAWSAWRRWIFLIVFKSCRVDFPCFICAYSLKHMRKACSASVCKSTCKHRSARTENRRNIYPCRSHKKPGNIFITVRYHNKSVKLMSHYHCFCWIRNQISCYKRILHSHMTHSYTVAYRYCWKFYRSSSCKAYSGFYRLGNFVEIHMSGNNLVLRRYNADKRSFHFLFCKTKGIKQRPVGRSFNAYCYIPAVLFHKTASSLVW